MYEVLPCGYRWIVHDILWFDDYWIHVSSSICEIPWFVRGENLVVITMSENNSEL